MLHGVADIKVWLKAPLSTRVERYAKRDRMGIEEARKIIREKEGLERKNWKKMYGFDYFEQEKKSDVVIDVAKQTPDDIVSIILAKLKRVFIVHRGEGRPGRDWYPYAKKELEKSGYTVSALRMPSPDLPIMKKWVAHLSKSVGRPNEHTYLIGHSAGVITILRYLEGLNKNEKVGGCVLVAGWVDDLGYKELRNFFTKPINWPAIRRHCRKFVAIHSSNDPFVRMYHGHTLKKKLGARLLIEHNKGHLTGEDRVKKLPSVVKSIKNF
jgi:predicted alpha/beta hydrolase family esterase